MKIPKFILMFMLALSMAACGTVPKTGIKIAAAADLSVSSAYVVFAELVAEKKVNQATVDLANKALDSYKSAEFGLLKATEEYQKNGDKAAVDRALSSLTAAQSDFMAIVQQYTGKK
jgi:hypothetical protein